MSDKHQGNNEKNREAVSEAQEKKILDSYFSEFETSDEGDNDYFEPYMNVMDGDIYGPAADVEWLDDAVLLWNEYEENNVDITSDIPLAACDNSDLSNNFENRCVNCHEILGCDDVYCKYCGAKHGEGDFKP